MLRIRVMNRDDILLAMRLKEQAGWNQTEADWQRMLDLEPAGCFVAEWSGQPVGTTTVCIFGPVAWIAMVLVDPHFRARGIGTALMTHALRFLDGRGVRTTRLDATALGKPIYEKLGFITEYELGRFQGILKPQGIALPVDRAGRDDWPQLTKLDREITATDRSKFLLWLFSEDPEALGVVRSGQAIAGFITTRTGTQAVQIGPCLADSAAGPVLFVHAADRYAGQPIFIDIPLGNRPAVEMAEKLGLAVQRSLIRMRRGPSVPERLDQLWASSGPEKG